MKTIKLFAFLMAMAIAMPAAAQVKVLGKSGNTSTTTAKKTTTTTAKKSAAPKASSSSYGSDYSNEGWQGGVGIVYQIADNFNAFGLHARIMYGISEEMRLSLMDEFYFKDGLSYLDNLDFDFHYLFNVADNIHVYPFGGATIQLSKSKDVTMSVPDIDNNGNIIYTDQTFGGESMSAFGLPFLLKPNTASISRRTTKASSYWAPALSIISNILKTNHYRTWGIIPHCAIS